MKEEWREIPGYDGKYLASNKGRIKTTHTWGRAKSLKDGIMNQVEANNEKGV